MQSYSPTAVQQSPDDYNTIWHYIDTNPAKWAQDTLYVTDFPDPVRRPGCCTNKEVTQMSRYFTKTLAALEPYTPGEQLKLPDLVKLNATKTPTRLPPAWRRPWPEQCRGCGCIPI